MIKKTRHTTKKKPATKATRAPKKKRPNPAAQALGRKGGLARKRKLSPERASEIGRQANAVRYGKPWPPPEAPAAVEGETPAPAVAPEAK